MYLSSRNIRVQFELILIVFFVGLQPFFFLLNFQIKNELFQIVYGLSKNGFIWKREFKRKLHRVADYNNTIFDLLQSDCQRVV